MATWPALVVLALFLIARCAPDQFEQTVLVPKQDIPAFTPIRGDQLVEKEMPRRDVDDSAVTKRSDLENHVTRAPLAKGDPVPEASVTVAAPRVYAGLQAVAFHADSDTAGELGTGASVKLLFAPSADAEDVEPAEIDAILLDAEEVKAGGTDYVVAINPNDRIRLLEVVARTRLLVVAG